MKNKKKTDFIISLGGNCSAASQLKQRHLRTEAMPFDYFFLRNEDEIKTFITALQNDFKGCFEKENFVELTGDLRGTSDLYQYKDTISGFNIIHMFKKPIENNKEYRRVKNIINRRLKRFNTICKNYQEICFIMSVNYEVSDDTILLLKETLIKKSGNKIKLIFVVFNATENTSFTSENLDIIKYSRSNNIYDYEKTNYEWHFLDNYKVRKHIIKKSLIKIVKKKRYLLINIFNFISTIMRIKIFFLGTRIDICIGNTTKE